MPHRWVSSCWTVFVLVGCAAVGCSTGSSAERDGEGVEAEKTAEADRSASKARAKASSERHATKLPDPSEQTGESGDSSDEAQCDIQEQDWKQIDFQDAPALHRELSEYSDAFAPCLDALPSGTKYFVAFEVVQGKVAGAEPADLSKLETRRLEDDERESMVQCLESKLQELGLTAEAAESSYDVTHPFCAP